ncbi:MAG: nucleotidyltransferase domain-containing protein [Parachlamydiaceae bacterium]|nr:nucleotidyltransferase domain-containing protein [Parachlamydiaceae bacterium]
MNLKDIRLEPFEIMAICKNFNQCFADGDHLWIFGSRVNPNARGGDIDLYIETTIKDTSQVFEKKSSFLYTLYEEIGLQRIDVIINLPCSDIHLPIYDIAKAEGIQLV